MNPEQISATAFSYELPAAKIALFPVAPRDSSKLLVYKNEAIDDKIFADLAHVLPANSFIVYNNTKVVQARLRAYNTNNAAIEIFLLNPLGRSVQAAMADTAQSEWVCMVGNLAKFREETLQISFQLNGTHYQLNLTKNGSSGEGQHLVLSWNAPLVFSELLEIIGKVPLPPYFKREAETADVESYQTVFAEDKGSVAAPTAGLHFTPGLMEQLAAKGCVFGHVTLHVGAGTFKPLKAAVVQDHTMHAEEIIVSRQFIQQLLDAKGPVTAVGTTSLRTLESLYWLGLQVLYNKQVDADQVFVSQWECYQKLVDDVPRETALSALLKLLDARDRNFLKGKTQIMIVPGYTFKLCDILITNFHQPQSTLLLLVAAFTNNNWKKIYEHALNSHYRFLSYGDSSILFREKALDKI